MEMNLNFIKTLIQESYLFFTPKDDSPVCTKQLTNYEQYLNKFEENNIKVVGINTAASDSHFSFCNKLGVKFPVLSDIF